MAFLLRHRTRQRLTRSARTDRAATIVETAFIAPVFFLLILSTFEVSLVAHQKLTLSNGASGAARAASAAANSTDADFRILQDFAQRGKSIKRKEIVDVVVFKAPSVEATLDNTPALAACKTTSIAGLCNHYTAEDLDRPSTDFGCKTGSVDRAWCPRNREASVDGPPDLIGVYVTVRHRSLTQAFGHDYKLATTRVLQIEPQKNHR